MKMKKVLGVAMATTMLMSTSVFAIEKPVEEGYSNTANSDYESTDVKILNDKNSKGSSKPGSNASVHDLDINPYNYQVSSVGYQIFTDKWLTSDSGEIEVDLDDWTILQQYGGTNNQVTIKLCDSNGPISGCSVTRTIDKYDSAYVKYTNINPSKKYYICFEVPTNSNRYSFNGSIYN